MVTLDAILNIFRVIWNHEEIDDEEWSVDGKIRRSLNIIKFYPNKYWKHPVIIYYLKYRNDTEFVNNFSNFLHKLISQLLARFIHTASLNFVKGDILKLDSLITKTNKPDFEFKKKFRTGVCRTF